MSMVDVSRREALSARSKALRARARAFDERLRDPRAKAFIRTAVFSGLDDVDRFFLGDQTTRPAASMWEEMWLDSAESVLASAERSFTAFELRVNGYGGPEHVRMVG